MHSAIGNLSTATMVESERYYEDQNDTISLQGGQETNDEIEFPSKRAKLEPFE